MLGNMEEMLLICYNRIIVLLLPSPTLPRRVMINFKSCYIYTRNTLLVTAANVKQTPELTNKFTTF